MPQYLRLKNNCLLFFSLRYCRILEYYLMEFLMEFFLLVRDEFMPDLQLRLPRLTYSVCPPLTKHLERISKFKETGVLKHIFNNEFDKICFGYDS